MRIFEPPKPGGFFYFYHLINPVLKMLFREVIGQQAVKQHLVEMVQHNRISHALLFLGKEGSGDLPLALAFANYVSLLPNSQAASAQSEASLFGEPVDHGEAEPAALAHVLGREKGLEDLFEMLCRDA